MGRLGKITPEQVAATVRPENVHFAHTTLLAGAAFVLTTGGVFYIGGTVLALALALGAVVFAITFFLARRAFQRASGGLSFRVGGMRG